MICSLSLLLTPLSSLCCAVGITPVSQHGILHTAMFVVYRSTREAVPTPDPGSLCVCIMRALRIVRCAPCAEFRYLDQNQITEIPTKAFSGLGNLTFL